MPQRPAAIELGDGESWPERPAASWSRRPTRARPRANASIGGSPAANEHDPGRASRGTGAPRRASSASVIAVASAAAWISSDVAADTSAAPALRSARSRETARSCCRTSPTMRAITSRNSTHRGGHDHEQVDVAACGTRARSRSPARSPTRSSGARAAAARGAARDRASARPGCRIVGFSAAEPHSR